MSGLTLDAGALVAIDRDDRQTLALLKRCDIKKERVTVPATALAQAMRDPKRQARLFRLVRQSTTDVVPLDLDDAAQVGRLLAASRTSDITDAHVVLCARRARQTVATSDPHDLAAIEALSLIPI